MLDRTPVPRIRVSLRVWKYGIASIFCIMCLILTSLFVSPAQATSDPCVGRPCEYNPGRPTRPAPTVRHMYGELDAHLVSALGRTTAQMAQDEGVAIPRDNIVAFVQNLVENPHAAPRKKEG